jgi:hypothetical protein
MNNKPLTINIENIRNQITCYFKSCKILFEKNKIETKKWNNTKLKILELLADNKIKVDEFKIKMEKLDKRYFKSKIYKKFGECTINNCYEYVKINLDELLAQIPPNEYKKPKIYTVDDYCNIMMLYHKHSFINNIISKPAMAKYMINLLKLKNIDNKKK